MSLNKLKPAWKQFLLFNSMQTIDQKEILSILEQDERQTTRRLPGVLVNIIAFLILTLACQGG
jgi:hypothetical protein